MIVTPEEWETDLESVDQVAKRATEPAPKPTASELPQPPRHCLGCNVDLFTTDHDPACPHAVVIS